jgi:LEA14-like dessication related protein
MNVARPLVAAAVAASFALAACSRPEPPTVQPISGRVTAISNTGITVEAKLEADNPNDFEIAVKSFTATIVLDHQYNIGTVSSSHAVTLPAKKKKVFELPITIKWNDVLALAPLAMSNKDVPYDASGTVKVGTGSFDVDVPFKVTGVVTHAQISQAVGKAVPHIPGLPF